MSSPAAGAADRFQSLIAAAKAHSRNPMAAAAFGMLLPLLGKDIQTDDGAARFGRFLASMGGYLATGEGAEEADALLGQVMGDGGRGNPVR